MRKEREPGEPDLPTDTTTDIEPDIDNRHQQTEQRHSHGKHRHETKFPGGDFSCKFMTCLPKTEKEKTQIWKTFWKWNSK